MSNYNKNSRNVMGSLSNCANVSGVDISTALKSTNFFLETKYISHGSKFLPSQLYKLAGVRIIIITMKHKFGKKKGQEESRGERLNVRESTL